MSAKARQLIREHDGRTTLGGPLRVTRSATRSLGVCGRISKHSEREPHLPESHDITGLLHLARTGDRRAQSRVLEVLYVELRRLAAACLRSHRRDHTLQPTALVHEAYLRLAAQKDKEWESRTHFLAVAAQAMRRVLVDCARARYAKKRWGGAHRVDFDPNLPVGNSWEEELLDIHAAMDRLAEFDARQARVVELRFFGGFTEVEIGKLLDISERTVKREWEMARAWLEIELSAHARNGRNEDESPKSESDLPS